MDILDRFIENAGESLREGYYRRAKAGPSGKKARLLDCVRKRDFTLICEIKHASPAGEYAYREIDAEKTAREFRESGADAISVVVEPKIFRGDIGNITLAKKAGLPVLFKDFIISEEQVAAARDAGADAVLLVVRVARRKGLDLDSLIRSAHGMGLEVLLESY